MNTEITTIDTNNFNAMAKVMGIASEGVQKKKASTLARLRINHAPILGADKILVKAGTYKLELPEGSELGFGTFFADKVEIRPFMQRFMYKRFVKGTDKTPNRYIKTVMADNLNLDLKDNDGGFNCGKPAGYIQDFKALPQDTQELIKQIKRVRVMLGTVTLTNSKYEQGNKKDLPKDIPFIWEIENRDAFKDVGTVFAKLAKMKRLPVQHMLEGTTVERKLPNGNSFFLPAVSMDTTKTLELSQGEQDRFADFVEWVKGYNEYIINAWTERAIPDDEISDDEIIDKGRAILDGIIEKDDD